MGSPGELFLPTAEKIHSLQRDFPRGRLVYVAAVEIALEREAAPRAAPVGAKAGLSLVPTVSCRSSIGEIRVLFLEAPPIDAVVAGGAEGTAVTESCRMFTVSPSGGEQAALRVARRPRDDVDHAVYGIG